MHAFDTADDHVPATHKMHALMAVAPRDDDHVPAGHDTQSASVL